MKINIILPNIGISGGNKIVFELADRLLERGHEVRIYYPLLPYLFKRKWSCWGDVLRIVKDILTNSIEKHVSWMKVKAPVLQVPYINNFFINNGDVCIATAWPTAYSVAKLTAAKGKKIYFVQHYEIWSGEKQKVDASYSLPLTKITTSKWIVKKIKQECQVSISKIIPCGIDLSLFKGHYHKAKKNKVLLIYDPLPWKGFEDGLRAFKIAKQKIPQLELVVFGKKRTNLSECCAFYYRPKPEMICQLYAEAGIFLFPSHCEGFGLPPMEAMAAACPVIATKVGAIQEYAENNISALLHVPGDVQGMAESIIRLYKQDALREQLVRDARKKIQLYSWNTIIKRWELFLREVRSE